MYLVRIGAEGKRGDEPRGGDEPAIPRIGGDSHGRLNEEIMHTQV